MSGGELVVQQVELTPATLFGTDNHGEIVARASDLAKTLEQVVRKQNLVVRIGQSEHVRVEGWTFLGSMLGVFPVVEWTRPVMLDETQVGWEARVEARTRSGEIVGAAEAECLRTEKTWANRDDYALRSMAQTRAVSKALRLPLGFVMQLAGFNPTPAEEMAVIEAEVRAPVVDMYDPDIPFGDAPPPVAMLKKDSPRWKKLNVLVGQLRKAERDPTEWIYDEYHRVKVRDADGVLHWSDLRDTLTITEADALIGQLDAFATKLPKAAA